MNEIELRGLIDRHMKHAERQRVFDVTAMAEQLYVELTPEQRLDVDRQLFRNRVMEVASRHFAALRW